MKNKIIRKVKSELPQVIVAPMALAESLIESVHPNLEWKHNALPQSKRRQQEKVAIILYGKQ